MMRITAQKRQAARQAGAQFRAADDGSIVWE